MRRSALLLLLGVSSACERPQERQEAAAAQDTIPPTAGAPAGCVEFAEAGLVFDAATRAGIAAQLGPPRAIEVTVLEGPSAGQDSLFLLRYPGLVVSLHRAAGGGEIIDAVRVRDNRYLRYPAVGIGAATEELIRHLGEPAHRAAAELTYVCHSHPARDDPLAFRLENGRVAEIVFTYYMD